MRVDGHTSSSLLINNWSPPRLCAQSTALHSVHTCFATSPSNLIVKFTNDTTVLSLINNNNETSYRTEVQHLLSWCENNNLALNIRKTKEIIVDFRRNTQQNHSPLSIGSEVVERVADVKYLGVVISEDPVLEH